VVFKKFLSLSTVVTQIYKDVTDKTIKALLVLYDKYFAIEFDDSMSFLTCVNSFAER